MPLDQEARLVALYDAHAAPIWRYVVRLTGDRAGADDVVQETLLSWMMMASKSASVSSPVARSGSSSTVRS